MASELQEVLAVGQERDICECVASEEETFDMVAIHRRDMKIQVLPEHLQDGLPQRCSLGGGVDLTGTQEHWVVGDDAQRR